jgi:spore photoproduct lyase
MMTFPIEEIWIDDEARDALMTEEILAKLPRATLLIGEDSRQRARELALEKDPLRKGKRILKLMKHKGTFVKPCPGTPEYVCCGLEILHIGQGCPMDCRYCALQVYVNRPVLEVFVNVDDMLDALGRRLAQEPSRFHRICTGEFTDSLALDPLTGLSRKLVDFFSSCTNASLEIKTKTDRIDSLLDVDARGRVIVSFSVNATAISATEEIRAAPLVRRLAAAVRAQARGYRLGFHFDPIIPFPGWEEAYTQVIDEIFDSVEDSAVAWISLGVLRFVPQLRDTVMERFGPIAYFHDAFLPGLDGKCRLFVDRRIAVYRMLSGRIRRRSPAARIYLCMESPHVWRESLGMAMETDEDLAAYLDAAWIP